VVQFQHSHPIAAGIFANVGIEGPLENIDSSGALALTFACEHAASRGSERQIRSTRKHPQKQKGPTEVDPFLLHRPGPDDPGGLGAEESETERTGPTQCILIAIQRGRRLAEKGLYCDSANDPVTVGIGRLAAFGAQICAKGTLAEATG
jgi:hypothetical protein